jgi:hypothetical protein
MIDASNRWDATRHEEVSASLFEDGTALSDVGSACNRGIGVRLGKWGIRETWRNKDMPCEGFMNGGYQVNGESRLCNVPESADSQAGLDKIGIGVNGQENDFCRAA